MSTKNNPQIDEKFVREYDRAAMRSMFASIFAAVVTARKREGGFTFAALANRLGVGKSVVSRWFNRDVNWEVNTIADIAAALDIDVRITAVDRRTGTVYTPAGSLPTGVRTFSHISHIAHISHIPEDAIPTTPRDAPTFRVIVA